MAIIKKAKTKSSANDVRGKGLLFAAVENGNQYGDSKKIESRTLTWSSHTSSS
jgi:hypothetical protein